MGLEIWAAYHDPKFPTIPPEGAFKITFWDPRNFWMRLDAGRKHVQKE